MYFRDPKKELPKAYERVCVRTADNSYYFAYYSSKGKWYPDNGSGVAFSINIVGWMPLSELGLIEIKQGEDPL